MSSPTPIVKAILDNYEADSPSVKSNLARILMHGKLGGSGKLVILPVDQGFEHGPARSFAVNPPAYDPHYHFQLALDAGLSAYAAPLGMLEAGAETFKNKLPTILKINSSNSLANLGDAPSQAITASVKDAIRLKCAAVGYTIYPGSHAAFTMIRDFKDIAREAKTEGLAVVLWSYPRGGGMSKAGETALDVTAYAAHMAALLGAHIIKVKPPTDHIEQAEAKKNYEHIPTGTLTNRVRHVVQSAFNGKRLVVFSGGGAKTDNDLLHEIRELARGGATGSIIGRNSFQRPKAGALELLSDVTDIYLKQAKTKE
ncbi:MAG: class I fructose-bisphosphate aldolase [Proteobacteria bacterium]|nr:class I fructose-bisphosphate aldolase [Pseudomonadota bacterium]